MDSLSTLKIAQAWSAPLELWNITHTNGYTN